MKEETKEEYLARHKKQVGEIDSVEETEQSDDSDKMPTEFKARLKSLFFLILLALFFYAILQIFGMLKSN